MKTNTLPYRTMRIDTYSYDLIDGRMYVLFMGENAIVIDPHVEEELLDELSTCESIRVILTHEHFDHISGVNWLRENLKCSVYGSLRAAEILSAPDNGTRRFPFLFLTDTEKYRYVKEHYQFPYECYIDDTITMDTSWEYFDAVSQYQVSLMLTPGHSPGGLSVLLDDTILFSGDNLLGNGQELKSIDSDFVAYQDTIHRYQMLLTVHPDILVCPGHGEMNSLQNYLKKMEDMINGN